MAYEEVMNIVAGLEIIWVPFSFLYMIALSKGRNLID